MVDHRAGVGRRQPTVARTRRLPALLLAGLLTAGSLLPQQAVAEPTGCRGHRPCPSAPVTGPCGILVNGVPCPDEPPGDGNDGTDDRTPRPVRLPVPPDPPVIDSLAAGAGGLLTTTLTARRGTVVEILDADGQVVTRATATGSRQALSWTTTSGEHSYVAQATDPSGRTSGPSRRRTVLVDADAPRLRVLSITPGGPAHGASRIAFETEPRATYTLAVAGRSLRGRTAAPTTRLESWLPNGRFEVRLTVRDATGNSTTTTRPLHVAYDHLDVTVARTSHDGRTPVVFAVRATPRSRGTLMVPGTPPSAFGVGRTGRALVSLRPADAAYGPGRVEVVDGFGRRGTARTPGSAPDAGSPGLQGAAPAARGLPPAAGWAAAGILLALAALLGLRLRRRRRTLPAAPGGTVRPVLDRLRVPTGHGRYERALIRYRLDLTSHREAEDTWRRRRDELGSLLDLALHERGSPAPAGLVTRPHDGERFYTAAQGELLEHRGGSEGLHPLGHGTLVVTDHRLCFVGDRRREWQFDDLVEVRHTDEDLTLLREAFGPRTFGVRYRRDPVRFRLLLDLAMADRPDGREEIARALEAVAAAHEEARPVPPVPPPPAGGQRAPHAVTTGIPERDVEDR